MALRVEATLQRRDFADAKRRCCRGRDMRDFAKASHMLRRLPTCRLFTGTKHDEQARESSKGSNKMADQQKGPAHPDALGQIQAKQGFICDMDGVIYHGNKLLPGAARFVEWLQAQGKAFLFLTNASDKTPEELQLKLHRMGVEVDACHFYTSALATARFVSTQQAKASAYIIGDHGLHNAMYDAGIVFNDIDPDYVIVGETDDYRFDHIQRAMNLVNNGARLIATNADITGPIEGGFKPACRALVAPIEVATGKNAYYVGKPNPLMMRTGLQMLGVHSGDAVMIGDRMDTDVISGVEAGMSTVLVMSGVSSRQTVEQFAFRPTVICDGVGDVVPQ